MSVTVEVGYEQVAEQTLNDLREEVGPVDVELKKITLVTD